MQAMPAQPHCRDPILFQVFSYDSANAGLWLRHIQSLLLSRLIIRFDILLIICTISPNMAGFIKDVSKHKTDGDDAAPSYGRMLYRYEPDNASGILAEQGEEITILRTMPDWLRAITRKGVGYVPASYVELVRADHAYLTIVCRFPIRFQPRIQLPRRAKPFITFGRCMPIRKANFR